MAKQPEMTPMMRQYHAIKAEVPDTLLLFRLGDFYELFYEDAVTAAGELEITLTARQKESGSPVPMCGVPHHAADGYIAKLLRKGYKVAVCDQTEPPKKGVKIVRREVTRVITPGTVTDLTLLKAGENNFLMGPGRYSGARGRDRRCFGSFSRGEASRGGAVLRRSHRERPKTGRQVLGAPRGVRPEPPSPEPRPSG